MLEGTQGEIPYTLPPINLLISFLPNPQLDVTRTIWRGLKAKKKERKRKSNRNRKKCKGISSVKLYTVIFSESDIRVVKARHS